MTTQNTEQAMKKVFVVDYKLKIHPLQVPISEWEEESGHFGAKIGNQPIIVRKGGWSEFTTYAGFETRKEAEEFKAAAETQRTKNRRKKK